jgi:hypothetical protein
MKKIIVVVTILLGSFFTEKIAAQISLNVNIGTQPVWGPVGYDHVDYYYIPDVDMFYNVPSHQYIYEEKGRWVFTKSVPARYRHYDFNRGYKVVVNEPSPYNHAHEYKIKYAKYKGDHSQQIIRNSHEEKYFINKNHPEHNKAKGKKNGKGHGRG